MRQKTSSKVIELNGKFLPIYFEEDTGRGCYFEMLSRIDEQLTAMLTHHNKVLVVRLDIHLDPKIRPDNNDIMSHYIRKMRKWAARKYKVKRLGFAWCRELCSSKKIHYHIALMIDGDKTQDHRTIVKETSRIVESYQHLGYGSTQFYPKDCFHMLHRGDKIEFNTAFKHLSYMAKERTKDYKYLSPKGKNFFTSRIKPSDRHSPDSLFSTEDKKVTVHLDKPKRKPKPTTDKPVHLMTDDERQLPLID